MRVIGGRFRGRRLLSPRGEETRPTSDRVREALFNILAPHVEGAIFLDAFAGTGAVGIEALSRGARRAVFVERNRESARVLAENLRMLELEGSARIISRPFVRAVPRLAAEEAPFGLVFLDPPYGPGELLRALRLCSADRFMSRSGLVIAEHDSGLRLPEREGELALKRAVRYGRSTLSLYGQG